MSEEEKQAINRIYDVTHETDGSYASYIDIDDICNYEEDLESCKGFCKAIDIVLNLIDKQGKEIEELKKDKKALLDNYNKVLGTFISKDKIREKLDQIYEEYQKILSSNRNLQEKNIATFQHNAMRTVLEELLEE